MADNMARLRCLGRGHKCQILAVAPVPPIPVAAAGPVLFPILHPEGFLRPFGIGYFPNFSSNRIGY